MRLKVSMLLSPPMPDVGRIFRLSERAEDMGYYSLVFPDHTLMIPPGYTPNVLALMAAISIRTGRIRIGTGVTDVVRYHPSVLAQFFATLEHLAPGRVFLGLGAGEAMNITPFGLEWSFPYTRLREGLEIIRKLWDGEKFSYSGKCFKLEDAFLQIKPNGKIPIYLGANSKKTRELAGEMCDGWMPIAETPKTYSENLKDVQKGAERAGRSIGEIDKALQIYTAVDNDRERAMNRARQFSGLIVSSIEKVEQAGYQLELPEGFPEKFYFRHLLLKDDLIAEFIRASGAVGDELIEDFFIVGTPAECVEKIEEFRRAGVEHLMIINIGPNPKFVMDWFAREVIEGFEGQDKFNAFDEKEHERSGKECDQR